MSYVVMALRGRLGNNLWQFASGLAIARALGADLYFDRSRVTERDHLLPQLIGAYYREATPTELRRVGRTPYRPGGAALLGRAARSHAHAVRRRVVGKSAAEIFLYDEPEPYQERLFELDLPVFLGGYFQDERFIARVNDEVAQAIQWPAETPSLPDLGPTVAVSFRRGDYNLYDAAIPVDYYDRAMGLLTDRVGEATFVLFSDDAGFVDLFREHAEHQGYAVVTGLAFGSDPLAQLRLMSQCDHAILATSSFAWWGAWIGDQRAADGRTVIAPAGWTKRIRERWIALEEVPGETFTYDFSTPSPRATLT